MRKEKHGWMSMYEAQESAKDAPYFKMSLVKFNRQ